MLHRFIVKLVEMVVFSFYVIGRMNARGIHSPLLPPKMELNGVPIYQVSLFEFIAENA